MNTRALIILTCCLATHSACATFKYEGLWGHEEYNCNGQPCESSEIKDGTARLTFEGLSLKVEGSRACGIWYSYAQKLYRGFLVGYTDRDVARIAYGQEMDHDQGFYEAPDYKHLPVFQPDVLRVLRPSHGQFLEESDTASSIPYIAFRKVSPLKVKYWSLNELGQWDTEFFKECLAGSNPRLEEVRSKLSTTTPNLVSRPDFKK